MVTYSVRWVHASANLYQFPRIVRESFIWWLNEPFCNSLYQGVKDLWYVGCNTTAYCGTNLHNSIYKRETECAYTE